MHKLFTVVIIKLDKSAYSSGKYRELKRILRSCNENGENKNHQKNNRMDSI